MIPVRIQADSPITTTGGIRPPMQPDHPLAATPCPVCDGPLTQEPITFVLVGIDPETRVAIAQGKTWCTGAAVVVHAACAGLDSTPKPACRRCMHPFDPMDTHEIGRAQYRDSGFCRACTANCHDSEDAFHRCEICDPVASPLTGGKQ